MRKDVVVDEFVMSAEAIAVHLKRFRKKKKAYGNYKKVFLGGDSTFLCDYFMYALSNANAKFHLYNSLDYISGCSLSDYRKKVIENTSLCVSACDVAEKSLSSLVFFFIDCCNYTEKEETLQNLKKTLSLAESN
ncbi:MAG: hypothetical protein IKC01_09455, partial [Clostridia bacterium]|nr:hypothetical protein [Clostridia bacterium]